MEDRNLPGIEQAAVERSVTANAYGQSIIAAVQSTTRPTWFYCLPNGKRGAIHHPDGLTREEADEQVCAKHGVEELAELRGPGDS